jgi:hypothetical protein
MITFAWSAISSLVSLYVHQSVLEIEILLKHQPANSTDNFDANSCYTDELNWWALVQANRFFPSICRLIVIAYMCSLIKCWSGKQIFLERRVTEAATEGTRTLDRGEGERSNKKGCGGGGRMGMMSISAWFSTIHTIQSVCGTVKVWFPTKTRTGKDKRFVTRATNG